jgi:hypothetical protein
MYIPPARSEETNKILRWQVQELYRDERRHYKFEISILFDFVFKILSLKNFRYIRVRTIFIDMIRRKLKNEIYHTFL